MILIAVNKPPKKMTAKGGKSLIHVDPVQVQFAVKRRKRSPITNGQVVWHHVCGCVRTLYLQKIPVETWVSMTGHVK